MNDLANYPVPTSNKRIYENFAFFLRPRDFTTSRRSKLRVHKQVGLCADTPKSCRLKLFVYPAFLSKIINPKKTALLSLD
jgi:hypothetical protein